MLTGTLDDFTLPEILRVLSAAGKSGRLEVTGSGGDGRVWFKGGDVCYGESSSSPQTRGKKLTSRNVLSEEQLEEQLEDTVFDLLRWDAGVFVWAPGVEAVVEVGIAISVENLIMEASRRLDEFHVIAREMVSDDSVLMLASSAPVGAVEISITPDEWGTLVLVDGVRTVADIAELSGCEISVAKRRLHGLVSAGLVGADRSRTASPKPDPFVELVEEPDVAPDEEVEAEPEPVVAAEPEPVREAEPEPVEESLGSVPRSPSPPRPPDPARGGVSAPASNIGRAAAARELSGLFDDAAVGRPRPPHKPMEDDGAAHEGADDDEVTKGLISRLIDGVKGQ